MFRSLTLTEDHGSVTLVGQIKWGTAFCQLPAPRGLHKYHIVVRQGRLRLNHLLYEIDGGTYLGSPPNGHFDLTENQSYTIEIDIGEKHGHPDKIDIVNRSFFKPALFEYSME